MKKLINALIVMIGTASSYILKKKDVSLPVADIVLPVKDYMSLNSKAQQFVICLKPIAEVWGFDPYIIFTHAWHESGAFDRVIGQFNYYGIKKPTVWKGITIDVTTHEFINGKEVKLVDAFIDFASCEQSILWYMNLIQRLYKNAYENRKVPELYFDGLINGRYQYATDLKYSMKLKGLYNDLKGMFPKIF